MGRLTISLFKTISSNPVCFADEIFFLVGVIILYLNSCTKIRLHSGGARGVNNILISSLFSPWVKFPGDTKRSGCTISQVD